MRSKRRQHVLLFVGLFIAAISLWLILRQVCLSCIGEALIGTDFRYAIPAFVVYFSNISLRASRWSIMCSAPNRRYTDPRFLKILLVSYAVNNILPARLGEFFRIEYNHRLSDMTRGESLAKQLVERLFDMFALAVVFLIALTAVRFDLLWNNQLAEVLISFLVILVILVLLVLTLPRLHTGLLSTWINRWFRQHATLHSIMGRLDEERVAMIAGLRKFEAAAISRISALTALIWGLEAFALYLVCKAVGFELQAGGVMLLLFLSALSTLIPTAPGYLGTYQLSFVIALQPLGISPDTAVAASIIQLIANIGLSTLIGGATYFIPVPRHSKLDNSAPNSD